MAGEDGEFDNFTYVNEHNLNLSEVQQERNNNRHNTELVNLKASFLLECDE